MLLVASAGAPALMLLAGAPARPWSGRRVFRNLAFLCYFNLLVASAGAPARPWSGGAFSIIWQFYAIFTLSRLLALMRLVASAGAFARPWSGRCVFHNFAFSFKCWFRVFSELPKWSSLCWAKNKPKMKRFCSKRSTF